jgi:predicted amidophosphoribosyltransferase
MTAPAKPACTRCGEPITPGARFCMKCGADVSGVQGAVATALMPAAEPNADELLLEHLRQATLG